MNKSENVAVLVCTCDLYEDAWNPFFRLLQIQWKECSEKIYLCGEYKKYNDEYFDIININSNKRKWGERIICALKQIKEDYIWFFLEDFFLQDVVNNEIALRAKRVLENDISVGVVRFVPHIDQNWCEGKYDGDPVFSDIPLKCNARNNAMISLWRKEYLLKILRRYENPWEFEEFGTVRSRKSNYRVLIQNYDTEIAFNYEYQIKYGYGISAKKWLKNNKILFEKYGIEVNYDRLGWYESERKNKIVGLKRTKKDKILMPLKQPKLFWQIASTEVKRIFHVIGHLRNRF